MITKNKQEYDIPGFITINELKYIIANQHVINKEDMLNGKTRMDAKNYYCQAGDLYPISNIYKYLE